MTPDRRDLALELRETPLGIALPQGVGLATTPAEEIPDFAAAAERLGFTGLWVSEVPGVPVLEPLQVLTAAAAATERARLGTAIVLSSLRQPLSLARDVATLDRISGGRVVLGLGLGSKPELYSRYGLSPERRLRRYLDGLALMERLWSGEPVSDQSEWWELEEIEGVPTVQQPRPPIFFGARRGKALERAALRGDGWIISGSVEAEEFEPALASVKKALASRDLPRPRFTIAKRVYLAVSDERDRDLGRARDWFGRHYGRSELADSVALIDSPDACVEALLGLRDLGIDHLILNPMFDEAAQLQRIAAQIAPRFQPVSG